MSQQLIPFGLQPDSGRLLSIFDVNNGRDCGCVCPSCGQGMLARQGDRNTWSFAHDKDSPILAKRPCELSFDSVCRHYLYQYLARRRKPMKWLLPARPGRHQPKGVVLALSPSQRGFDFECRFEQYTLYLLIDYPGRRQAIATVGSHEAVLLIDIAGIKRRYLDSGGREVSLDAEIERLIVGDLGHKRWQALPQSLRHRQSVPPSSERRKQPSTVAVPQPSAVTPSTTPSRQPRATPFTVDALPQRMAALERDDKARRTVPSRIVGCNECGANFVSDRPMMGKGLKCDNCRSRPHNRPLQLPTD
ncbi:hypothetical protein EDC56_2866 [Sinobacterium caligoides]|uniref:Competence protein CoiA-like protein n=1 Tax=Sinobacterium caligoides TaxID=933926 RepID=A0A3N2DKC1_9GAMM|nr:hypothetical protein [Sinobacterium caligoides]ROS00228.1 hypothetical protein EDC56_2866 [Sinobacterium caligoides]